jgi:nucleoside-diphosphate-sugar epimerase
MTDNEELHVVFGTGPVGMAVMDALMQRGKRVRMVNRSGRARVPDSVEVLGGNATDETFAREASEGASVIYFSLNPPYDKWPELFPPLQAGVLEGAASAGAKLVAMENLYMYGPTDGRQLTEDLPLAPNTRKGSVRARMSEELMEAHRSGKVRVAIGRASDYFGPRVLSSGLPESRSLVGLCEARVPRWQGIPTSPTLTPTYPTSAKGWLSWANAKRLWGRRGTCPAPRRSQRASSWR